MQKLADLVSFPKSWMAQFVSGHYFLYVIDDSKLEQRFLELFIRTPAFREQVAAQGSTNYAAIRPADVLGYEIPALSEQRRVVARIEELAAQIDEARALRREATEETNALVASETNALFTGKAMHRWPIKLLDEIAEIRSGVTLGRQLTGRTIRLPYLRVANVQDGHLDLPMP